MTPDKHDDTGLKMAFWPVWWSSTNIAGGEPVATWLRASAMRTRNKTPGLTLYACISGRFLPERLRYWLKLNNLLRLENETTTGVWRVQGRLLAVMSKCSSSPATPEDGFYNNRGRCYESLYCRNPKRRREDLTENNRPLGGFSYDLLGNSLK